MSVSSEDIAYHFVRNPHDHDMQVFENGGLLFMTRGAADSHAFISQDITITHERTEYETEIAAIIAAQQP
jgi:hypothetical protein